MSNTYKHKDKGKYQNKVLKYNDVCDATKNMWDRHNSDISKDKQKIFKIKSKIAEKELKTKLKTTEAIQEYKTIDWYRYYDNLNIEESILKKHILNW
jgi:hypothetical protein